MTRNRSKGKFVPTGWSKITCQMCGFAAENKTTSRLHAKATHGIKKLNSNDIGECDGIVCGVCKKRLANISELSKHMTEKTHTTATF